MITIYNVLKCTIFFHFQTIPIGGLSNNYGMSLHYKKLYSMTGTKLVSFGRVVTNNLPQTIVVGVTCILNECYY